MRKQVYMGIGMTAVLMCAGCSNDADETTLKPCEPACEQGQTCEDGVCLEAVDVCEGAWRACDGVCRDIGNDSRNCGACGHVCDAGLSCVSGECVELSAVCDDSQCPEGQRCVDGACAVVVCDDSQCPEGQRCVDGACAVVVCDDSQCPEGQRCVDGACAVAVCDDSQCPEGQRCVDGACAVAVCDDSQCPEGQRCVDGACAVAVPVCDAEGVGLCGERCADLMTDAFNCGTCGTVCTGGKSCVKGVCTLVCETGLENCEAQCADLKTDARNCGACGTVCGGGMACEDGACHPQCLKGQVICQNICDPSDEACEPEICADLKADAANCGRCGNACDAGLFCVDGTCGIVCPSSQAVCGEICASLNADEKNCGECGHACARGEVCRQGACEPFCPTGQTECDGQCFDLQTTFSHCGACGQSCNDGQVCDGGQCVKDCGSGLIACDGNCIDPNTDANYCGAAGHCSEESMQGGHGRGVKCEWGQVCRDGACVCERDGQTACLVSEDVLSCTDASKDDLHCGCTGDRAGMDCGSLAHAVDGRCEDSVCRFACKDGYADCDTEPGNGCEVAVMEDVENCGACGKACVSVNASEVSCKFGVCVPTCKDGFVACNRRCVSLNSNDNCGACGNACGEGAVCSGGYCVVNTCTLDNGRYASVNVDGKKITAYCVSDPATFAAVRDAVALGKAYPDEKNTDNAYILMTDIDLGVQASWSPVGTGSKPFTGYYLGNGKTVRGKLTCVTDDCGLLGYAKNAVLRDFNLDITVSSSGNLKRIGGLVGILENGKLYHSTGGGSVSGYQYVGGLVGSAQSSSLGALQSKMSVSGLGTVGGVAGYVGDSEVSDSQSASLVTGSGSNIGGFAGYALGASFEGCSSSSNVTISGSGGYHAGVFAGYSKQTAFKGCQAAGNAKGWGGIGGFIGRADESKFDGCAFSKGMVAPAGSDYGNSFGGFVSYDVSSEFKNCSASGNIDGGVEVGGFTSHTESGKFENCTFEGTVNDRKGEYAGGFVGYTVSESAFKNCMSKGSVQSVSERVGGFAGGAFGASFVGCSSDCSVKGLQSVGGHTGYAQNSTYSDCHATGNIGSTVTNNVYLNYGGFIGGMNSCSVTGCTASGNVATNRGSGAFIGVAYGTSKLMQSASFGNVNVCTEVCAAGAFVGSLNGTLTIDTCFSTGNANGNFAGGMIADVFGGSALIADSYVAGKVSGVAWQGAVVGHLGGAVTVKNVYWWQGSNAKPGATAFAANSTHYPYVFKQQKAVVASQADAPLAGQLNQGGDKWVSRNCLLSTGPGTAGAAKYEIPVLKGMKVSFCE